MKVDINVTFNTEIEFIDGILTKEVMDNYDEYFHDVSNDSDFDNFETQEQKHQANICQYLARGETNFIEGYGDMRYFISKTNIEIYNIDKCYKQRKRK